MFWTLLVRVGLLIIPMPFDSCIELRVDRAEDWIQILVLVSICK